MKKLIIIILVVYNTIFSQDDLRLEKIRSMTLLDLMQIKVVTATKNLEKISDIPASVVVISAEEIDALGYQSYTEILNNVAGFYMIDDSHYLGHKNFGVRGFFSPGAFGNVIVLVNGVQQLSDEYMDYPDTKITVPIQAIDKIEIIRGPMSVIYGSGAFFGAINIITNEDYNKNQISLGTGNYGQNSGSINISSEKDDLKFRFNGGFSDNSGIDTKYSNLTTDLSIVEFAGLNKNATTKDQFESSKKYFDFSFQKNNIFGNFSYNESLTEIIDGMPSFGNGSEISHNSTNINLGFNKEIQNFSVRAMMGYYLRSHHLDYERFYTNSFDLDAEKSRAFDIDLTSKYKTGKFEALVGLYTRNVVELMQIADFPQTSIARGDGEIMLPRNDLISTQSIYSQITVNPLKKIKIIGGLRLEHLSPYEIIYSRGVASLDTSADLPVENRVFLNTNVKPENNGLSLTPSFAMLYDINENNVIKLMFGTAVKQPTFMDNLRQSILSQPFLKPQKIQTLELNYLSYINGNINTNISLFFNHLYDLITQTNEFSQETGWKFLGTNQGELMTTGAEASIRYKFHKNSCSNFSIIYQQTKNKENGFENYNVGYSPQILANLCLRHEFPHGFSLAVTGKYTSEMKTEWQTNTIPEEGQRIAEAIPDYYCFNSNMRLKSIFGSPFSVHFAIKNILDEEIRYPTTKSNSWIDKGYLDFGRRYFANLYYRF